MPLTGLLNVGVGFDVKPFNLANKLRLAGSAGTINNSSNKRCNAITAFSCAASNRKSGRFKSS